MLPNPKIQNLKLKKTSFYVKLPIYASMKTFPGNNPSKFSVKQAHTLEMNDQYEDDLAEIQFPNSYFNICEGEVWVHYTHLLHERHDTSAEHTRDQHVLNKLPPALYDSAEDFIADMNRLLPETNSVVEILYNKTTKRASIRCYEKGTLLSLSDALNDI